MKFNNFNSSTRVTRRAIKYCPTSGIFMFSPSLEKSTNLVWCKSTYTSYILRYLPQGFHVKYVVIGWFWVCNIFFINMILKHLCILFWMLLKPLLSAHFALKTKQDMNLLWIVKSGTSGDCGLTRYQPLAPLDGKFL